MRAPRQLDSLTSLRFVAALVVFLHHAAFFVWSDDPPAALEPLSGQGAVGVSFFFMLSGFVLAWSGRPQDTAPAFYRRRVARIVPAYWVAALGGMLVTTWRQGSGLPTARSGFTFTLLQSWVPDSAWYMAGNGVSWSLSTEVFFYACFPVLFLAVRGLDPRRRMQVLVAAVVLAVALPALVPPENDHSGFALWLTYISPPVRLLEFLVGVLLASFLLDGRRLRLGVGTAALVALTAYLAAGLVPVWARNVPTTIVPFALLIYAFAQADLDGRRSWLRRPLLVRLGLWSYAFYLVHQLVLRVIQVRTGDPSELARSAMTLGAFAASLLAAYLLYATVERPLERRLRGGRAPMTDEHAHPTLDPKAG